MQRLIPVFQSAAFQPEVGPEALYRAAQSAKSEEQREAVEEYAFDMATILDLPTIVPARELPWGL
jgi:hypothetical protein